MLRHTLLVAALLAWACPAPAQGLEDYDYESLAFQGLGIEIGQIWPANAESTITLGIRGDLGSPGPNVRIVPGIMYWSSKLEEDELQLGDIEISDLALNLDGHYEWDLGVGATPYVGAGLGLHILNGEGEEIDDTFVEELLDAITPGLNLVAGTEVNLVGPVRIFAEARAVVPTQVRSLGLSFGAYWNFAAVPLAGRRTPEEGR